MEVADNDKTVTSVIDADIPATQKIEELGDVSAQAAVKVDSLGDVIAEAESKAGRTAGMKAQVEAHKQVGAAAEEAARKARTSSQVMQDANVKAVEQVTRMRDVYKNASVPAKADTGIGAGLPAFKEINDLRRSLISISKDAAITEEEFGRAVERNAAKFESATEAIRRAGLTHRELSALSAESRSKLIEAAEAIDAEAKAAREAAAAEALLANARKAAEVAVEEGFLRNWETMLEQEAKAAREAAAAEDELAKARKRAEAAMEEGMLRRWEESIQPPKNSGFGPSAEYLGQSRLASLSPDYAKDQRMNALSQERVATEKALADAIASGAIPAAKAGEVQKQLAAHYAKAEEKAAKMNGTIHLSNNAYLQLTASARNTFDSLAAGLPISQVMITQGAQVVSALASEGSVMRALISPTGAATAAVIAFVGAMAMAMARAASLASQLRGLQATAMAYGNISVSAEDAAEAIKKIADNSKYSRSEATEAVKELTKMRVLSSESRAGIEGVMAAFGTATGKGISDATKELGSAFNGTYEGIKKLDEVYGFLDNSQLSAIRGMMKMGQTAEATRMAMTAFTKQMDEAGKMAEGSAAEGFQQMAKQWNAALDNMAASPGLKAIMQALTSVTNQTAGFMGSIDARRADVENRIKIGEQSLLDSPDSLAAPLIERQVAELRAELQVMKNREREGLRQFPDSMREGRYRRGDTARVEADASAKLLTPLQEGLASSRDVAAAPAYLRAAEQARKDAMSNAPAGMNSADRRTAGEIAYQQALLQVTTALGDQMLATNRQVLAEKELAEASLLGARAMSEARAAAAGREAAANGGNAAAARAAVLAQDEYRAMGALNAELSKLDDTQHLVNRSKEAGAEVATVEVRLKQAGLEGTSREADARLRLSEIVKKEAVEKSRLAKIEQDSLRQQTALLSAQNDNISASERAFRQAQMAADAQYARTGNEQERNESLALAGLTRQQSNAAAGQSLRMQMRPAVARDQQMADLNAATGLSPEDYAAKAEEIRRIHEDNTIARLDLENDFLSGAERAMRRYIQSVGATADQIERVMTNAFKGMEDALVEFATTGKLNFADLANSIISDLIRMQIQASITGPLSGALNSAGGLGGLFGSLFGSSGSNPVNTDATTIWTSPGTISSTPLTSAHGNVFANDNVVPFANGGTFTNTVVAEPTLFKFAQGAKMGLMGEAGPEAIVPLTRGPNGDLGVQAFGGGGGAPMAEAPRISVEINNYGSSKDFEVEQDFSGLVPIVRIIARDEANKRVESFAQNEMPKSLRGEYKLNRPPVARG